MKVLVSEDIWDFNLDAALGDISEQRREQALTGAQVQARTGAAALCAGISVTKGRIAARIWYHGESHLRI